MVNLTVAAPLTQGFTSVYPCTGKRPNTSNSNFTVNQTVAAFVIAESDAHGDVCVYSSASTQLIVDQVGATTLFSVNSPVRLLDTRTSTS